MAGIWTNTGERWKLGSPQGFKDEATLHRLIEENPQILPLAGSPSLTVLGSEIPLGTGSADIVAVESSGRPVVIEVKLARSAEARRAIVSQILAYASYLYGCSVESLEQIPLRKALSEAGYTTILEAVQAQDQEGAVDADLFAASMQQYLDRGDFRLVLVLDEVSAELERIVAYLDTITVQSVTIDLITVSVYQVNGMQVALPQRVSPDIGATPAMPRPTPPSGILSDGPDAFRTSIEGTTGETRKAFLELVAWAESLASQSNVRLFSYTGVGAKRFTLLPYVMPDKVGLVTIWNDKQQPYISVWRSVFGRLAPNSIEPVEKVIAPVKLGQGNVVWDITPQLLEAVKKAYQEAGSR